MQGVCDDGGSGGLNKKEIVFSFSSVQLDTNNLCVDIVDHPVEGHCIDIVDRIDQCALHARDGESLHKSLLESLHEVDH